MEKIRSALFFWSFILLILGIFLVDLFRVLPSLGMILMVLTGLSYFFKKPKYFNQVDALPFLSLSITFIILLPSAFYSENFNYLMEKWQIAIPYLIFPLLFIRIPKLSERRNYMVYAFFFWGVFVIALTAFIYYLLNQDVINQLYLESRVMPTLFTHHPTLSLMIVYAIYISYWLYQNNFVFKFRAEKNWIAAGGLFLFIFIHVFSVRSGLLALYVVIFVELGRWMIQKRQFKKALQALILMLVVGGATLFISPTVSNKISNTTQDLSNYQNKGSANNQSLGSRLISYRNAIRIAEESSVWWGCGLGDINDLNIQIFKTEYPDIEKIIIPHNQFLFYFAAIGIIGLLLFILAFYFPLFYKKSYLDPMLLIHMVILSIGFQFEAPLETQIGVAYSLLFILLPIHKKFGPEIFN